MKMSELGGYDVVNQHPPARRIERSHYLASRHPKFCQLVGIIYMGTYKVGREVPTAAIDKYGNVFYNEDFIGTMNDKNLNYVMLHEKVHFALQHVFDFDDLRKHSPELYNIAIDHAANNFIEEVDPDGEFAVMPRKTDGTRLGHCDHKYRGWGPLQIFKDLIQNPPPKGGEGGEGDGGFDSHDFSDKEGEEGMTPEEREAKVNKVKDAINDAIRRGKYLADQLNGNVSRSLMALTESKVRWQDQFHEFCREQCQGLDDATWRSPNRRFIGQDIYMPSYYKETVGKLIMTIDMSGSIGLAERTAAVSEAVAVCKTLNPSEFHILYWDTEVCRHEIYKPDEYDTIATTTKPVGGGGTLIEPTAEAVSRISDVVAVINITDGYLGGGWGVWNVPVLWCITSDIKAPFGKTIKLEVGYG